MVADMTYFLAKNNHPPLESHQFLSTKTIAEAERALAKSVEPRRFSPSRRSENQGIRCNRYQMGEIQIYGLKFEGALRISSDSLESVNIICPISGVFRSLKEKGASAIGSGFAMIDSPGDRVAVEWESESTSMVVRIPKETLIFYCNKLYDMDVPRNINFLSLLDMTQGPGKSVGNILNTILMEADNKDSLLNQGVLTENFQEMLVTSLLNSQPNSLTESLFNRDKQVRPFYIKRATEYIQENIEDLILLSDLVEETGVSLRTLQAGFSKFYDVGPSAYIKQLKMRGARESLLSESPLETTVADVAARYGFYNPCNFSVNYKKLFGETPSETLRKQ